MALQLQSPAFHPGGSIPAEYTCDGQNISPLIEWSGAPPGTKSFALVVDDPDAPMGTWDHWIVFNIPPTVDHFGKDIAELPAGALGGKNSWGRTDYGGPCPPDREHRYFFKLYALDALLPLQAGASKKALESAMKGHILMQTELMGRYDRKRL